MTAMCALLLACSMAHQGCTHAPATPISPKRSVTQESALREIIASRPETAKARDVHRHPQKTLEFFGIAPGMTVVEVLPGRGWYSAILSPYLGPKGTHHAVNYADEMWPMFGRFDDAFIATRKKQMVDWPAFVTGLGGVGQRARGSAFGRIPRELYGTADAVLFIRAVHNLNRFEAQAAMRSKAIRETFKLLKSGGVVGVVQHRAPESASDDWAAGQSGYLKQSAVIAMFEDAGFILQETSELNANPKDTPSVQDVVWRLPPRYRGSEDDPRKRAALDAIGESDRMTLRFVKP